MAMAMAMAMAMVFTRVLHIVDSAYWPGVG